MATSERKQELEQSRSRAGTQKLTEAKTSDVPSCDSSHVPDPSSSSTSTSAHRVPSAEKQVCRGPCGTVEQRKETEKEAVSEKWCGEWYDSGSELFSDFAKEMDEWEEEMASNGGTETATAAHSSSSGEVRKPASKMTSQNPPSSGSNGLPQHIPTGGDFRASAPTRLSTPSRPGLVSHVQPATLLPAVTGSTGFIGRSRGRDAPPGPVSMEPTRNPPGAREQGFPVGLQVLLLSFVAGGRRIPRGRV